MPKLKLPNIDEDVAIDIHTHAEEPCGMHGDDGYDDFQAQMPDYFKSPHTHPHTVPETAAYYPDLKIILAHPSFPWQEEALSVATHKPNVYIDLSGWSPKYFPPILVRYINSILQDKMLFGSDWPVITPDRWLADFAKLDIREEIRPKVLKANARKILGI